MKGVLAECRKRLGEAPRSFSPGVVKEIRGRYNPLMFMHPWDSLMRTFFDQAKLRERGEVVWALVLQANDFLYAPGLNGESHPATVLHAGPALDDPSVLLPIGQRIVREGREASGKDEESRTVAAMLHPSRRKNWFAVPESRAQGHELYCSDMLVFRKLLPPQPRKESGVVGFVRTEVGS